MPSPSPSPESVVRLAGGICTLAQLRAAGLGEHRVRAATGAGSLLRLRRGVYAVGSAPADGVAAVEVGGRLAGLSAAASFGLWGGWNTPLHVCVPKHSGHVAGRGEASRPVAGRPVVVHWNDDRHDDEWCWRVCVRRCLRHVMSWHDVETAVAVAETALTAGLLSVADLAELCVGPHAALAGAFARCAAGVQSGVESLVRQRLESVGLVLRRQVRIDGVGHVDLGLVGTRVFVEVDGFEFHRSPAQFAEDRRRDAEARVRGYVPLRFTAVQVRDSWPWVESMVLGAVAQFGRTARR